jgi:hypothetical protein
MKKNKLLQMDSDVGVNWFHDSMTVGLFLINALMLCVLVVDRVTYDR